jgi:uncharacterized membrane protein
MGRDIFHNAGRESTEDCGGVDKHAATGQFPAVLYLPDPLHPFAVHFPVAFLLLGSLAVVLSLLWPGSPVLRLAALMMILGAAGTTWAHSSGMVEAAQVRYVGASVSAAVQEHKSVSDLMLLASWLAAVAASVSLFALRIPGVSLLSRLVGVAAVIFLLWTMQATLHTGSELTHQHFFGPNAPKPAPGTEEVIRLKVE